jgi:quercetin dioxygenase-like cupin family protein
MMHNALKLALGLSLVAAGSSQAGSDITLMNADQLNWEETPEGVAFAALVGDRFKTEYMAVVRLPAGTISPPHIKSATMYGVMIKGEMTHVALDQPAGSAQRVRAGAYYKIPAGIAHVSSCVSETDCETFLYQDGAFDFLPVSQ